MAAHATRFTDAAFTLVVACGGGMLDAQNIERVVVDLMRFELEAREAVRAVAPARAPAEIEAALRLEAAARQTLVAAIAHNDYAAVAQPVNAALSRLGLPVAVDGPDWRMVARRAAIGLVAVCEENARREQGVYADGAALLSSALAPAAPAATAVPHGLGVMIPSMTAHGLDARQAPIPTASAAPIAWASAAPAPFAPAPSVAPIAPVALTAPEPSPPRPALEMAEARRRGRRPAQAAATPGRTPGFAYQTPSTPNPAAPNGAMKFFAVGMDYVARRSGESASWRESSAPQVASALKAFRAIEGDLPCDACDAARFAEFFDTYRRLPANWGKGGRTPIEDIDRADAEDAALADEIASLRARSASQGDIDTRREKGRAKRVKVATLYRVMQDMQRIVRDEGMRRGCFARNVMEDVIWSKRKLEELQKDEADTPRLPWGDRAAALFATPVFTGPLADPGDPMFWLPLFGHNAGLRMEEAAQLKTDDVDTIDGVPVVRIRQGAGQHLKNLSARRAVPIHDDLLALGLMRLVEMRRREGQEWLFPDLARGAARGRKSEVFSGLFTEYRRAQGLHDLQRDFHSLRKDFNVNMKRSGVGLEIRKRLMGHRLVDVTETRYDPEGSPIRDYRDAVNANRLDISGIGRPFGSADAAVPAKRGLRLVR